jgi:hypothetical protein
MISKRFVIHPDKERSVFTPLAHRDHKATKNVSHDRTDKIGVIEETSTDSQERCESTGCQKRQLLPISCLEPPRTGQASIRKPPEDSAPPISEAQQDLWMAIRTNDAAAIDLAIERGASIDAAISEEDMPPIFQASFSEERTNALRQILAHNPIKYPYDQYNMSAIGAALEGENKAGLKLLLEAGFRLQESPYWQSMYYINASYNMEDRPKLKTMIDWIDACHNEEPR